LLHASFIVLPRNFSTFCFTRTFFFELALRANGIRLPNGTCIPVFFFLLACVLGVRVVLWCGLKSLSSQSSLFPATANPQQRTYTRRVPFESHTAMLARYALLALLALLAMAHSGPSPLCPSHKHAPYRGQKSHEPRDAQTTREAQERKLTWDIR
jgi:hypothetical protein